MGEDVVDCGERRCRRAAASSVHSGPGKRRHAAEHALGRAAHQPARSHSRSIHQAMPWRCGRAALRLGAGKALRLAAREGGAVGVQRAGRSNRALAAGRWSRRGPSSPGRNRRPVVGRHRVGKLADAVPCSRRAAARCHDSGRRPARHWCRSPARAGRTRSRRSRRRCRRRCPAACEARPRSSGKPPRAATSRAQAIRLRARA